MASGKARDSLRQKKQPGESTADWKPRYRVGQCTGLPSTARRHIGQRQACSGFISSHMWQHGPKPSSSSAVLSEVVPVRGKPAPMTLSVMSIARRRRLAVLSQSARRAGPLRSCFRLRSVYGVAGRHDFQDDQVVSGLVSGLKCSAIVPVAKRARLLRQISLKPKRGRRLMRLQLAFELAR